MKENVSEVIHPHSTTGQSLPVLYTPRDGVTWAKWPIYTHSRDSIYHVTSSRDTKVNQWSIITNSIANILDCYSYIPLSTIPLAPFLYKEKSEIDRSKTVRHFLWCGNINVNVFCITYMNRRHQKILPTQFKAEVSNDKCKCDRYVHFSDFMIFWIT